TLARQANAVGLGIFQHQLSGGEATGDIDAVIVAAELEFLVKEENLNLAMGVDRAGEKETQHAPCPLPLLPGRGLLDAESIHRKGKGSREVSPQGFAVEIGAMQRVPGRVHLVPGKRVPGRKPLRDYGSVELLDGDPVGGEHRALI